MHCKPHLGRAFSLALCALWLAAAGCKRRPPEEAVPSASAPLASAAPPAPRCSAAAPGKAFTVGERTALAPANPEGDDEGPTDEPGLPFAIELGSGVATADGFAVAGLSTKAGKTTAIVALVDADVGRGQLVELGRLHGDADPPELASRGQDLIALVHDTDAGGELLRLVALRRGPKQVDAVIGAEIAESRDESRVARVALGKERGVAIWDGWHKTAKHGVIRVATFAKSDVSVVTRPRVVSAASEDAEMPSLVPRPGGFWAAWITRAVEPDGQGDKRGRAAAPAPSVASTADPTLVEMGARYVTVVPLDENGSPMSEPKAVSSKNEHVLVFDLAPGPDGAAWIAWRDEATAPGAEERLVHVARVKPDGSVDKEAFEDEQVGVGVPSLLVDPRPPSGPSTPWISLGSVSDETRLATLGPTGRPADTLAMEPEVRSAEPLVLAGGRMLLARPRGLAVELSVVQCKPGPAP